MEKRHGWIYKTSQELSDELMGIGAPPTIAKDLVHLEELGYLESRNNPKYKWDHTKQYRPNFIKIQTDLLELGYIHEKIGISQSMLTEYKSISLRDKSVSLREKSSDLPDRTIPEITSEITSEITPEIITTTTTAAESEIGANSEVAEVFKAYESEIGLLTNYVREDVLDAIKQYPKEWIVESIKEAAKNNTRKWSYALAILKSWQVNGYKTDIRQKRIDGPKAYQNTRKAKQEDSEDKLNQFRKLYQEQKQNV